MAPPGGGVWFRVQTAWNAPLGSRPGESGWGDLPVNIFSKSRAVCMRFLSCFFFFSAFSSNSRRTETDKPAHLHEAGGMCPLGQVISATNRLRGAKTAL